MLPVATVLLFDQFLRRLWNDSLQNSHHVGLCAATIALKINNRVKLWR